MEGWREEEVEGRERERKREILKRIYPTSLSLYNKKIENF
jgi:hypothetical protein